MSDKKAMSAAARYQQFLEDGEFRLPKCRECRRFVYYPRETCPFCGNHSWDWVIAEGGGTVYSTTVVRRKTEAGGPLNLALIELDEGVRMASRVTTTSPESVRIGQRVYAYIQHMPGESLVLFLPETFHP